MQSVTNALGQLAAVIEFPNSNGTTLETDYTYDGLGNLHTVTQNGNITASDQARQRSFWYDPLSRLILAHNPESGFTCYGTYTLGTVPGPVTCSGGYYPTGNLKYRMNQHGVTTQYTYDALNRLTSKTYSNDSAGTPSSCYSYDTATNGIGLLGVEWTQKGPCSSAPPSNAQSIRRVLSYDAMARITQEQQCTQAHCTQNAFRPMGYTYDLAGDLTGSSDGISLRNFITEYDQVGRLTNFSGGMPGASTLLFSAQSYSPYGLTSGSIGSSLNLTKTYDVNGRVLSQSVVKP